RFVLHGAMAQLRVRQSAEGGALTAHELELLSAPALHRFLEHGTGTVVVPFGSLEDQNGHLPLGADSMLADLIGRAVAAGLDAVLAPTLRVGAPQQQQQQQEQEMTGALSVE